jgi:hypothetical protein
MCGISIRLRKIGSTGSRVIAAVAAVIACTALDVPIDARNGDSGGAHIEGVDGPWCLAAHDRDGMRDCGYKTFDQCFTVASAIGGTCRPNFAAFLIPDDAPYRTYHAIYRDLGRY